MSEARNEELRSCFQDYEARSRKVVVELTRQVIKANEVASQQRSENKRLREGRDVLLRQIEIERTKAVMSPIAALPREQIGNLRWETGRKLGQGGCAEVFEVVVENNINVDGASEKFAFKSALVSSDDLCSSELQNIEFKEHYCFVLHG
jgi:hypothetical protein